jgi:hypothetical protein
LYYERSEELFAIEPIRRSVGPPRLAIGLDCLDEKKCLYRSFTGLERMNFEPA